MIVKRFRAKRLSTVALVVTSTLGFAVQSHAELPSVRSRHGTPITPAAAWTYYGAVTTNTQSTAAWATRPVEIKTLAQSLGSSTLSSTDYADAVNRYIQSNIRVELRFGLSKGALGALVDQSGTPFDQAQLMVELLREAGISASYNVGTVTLSAVQFGAWSGLVQPTTVDSNNLVSAFTVDMRAACEVLADGSIPSNLGTASGCASLSGALSSVQIAHIWVTANGHNYDPSFKGHDIWQQNPNLLSAICGSAGGCGTALASSLGAGGATSITNPSYSNLTQTLQSQGITAEQWIRSLSQSALTHVTLEQVIGGRRLRPAPAGYIAPPYTIAGTQYTWTGNIPNQFRTAATISVPGAFAPTFYLDETAGRRIVLSTYEADGQNAADLTLNLEQLVLAQGSLPSNPNSPAVPIVISLNHPYANAELGTAGAPGSYQDETETLTSRLDLYVKNGIYSGHQAYSIILQAGNSGPSAEAFMAELIRSPLRISPPSGTATWGNANSGLTKCNELLPYSMGAVVPFRNEAPYNAKLAAEYTLLNDLIGNVNSVRFETHHLIGYFSNTSDFDNSGRYAGQIKASNVVGGVSASAMAFDKTVEQGAEGAANAIFGAIEGSAINQIETTWTSGTATDLLKVHAQSTSTFLLATPTTWAGISGSLSGYSSDLINFASQYASAGYNLIIPQSAPVSGTINGMTFNDPRSGFFAWKPGFGRVAAIDFLLGKGAGGSENQDPVKPITEATKKPSAQKITMYTPEADVTSGRLNIDFKPDLTAGSADFPYGLAMHRSYSSDAQPNGPCIQLIPPAGISPTTYSTHYTIDYDHVIPIPGWTTNWDWSASYISDVPRALGSLKAIDAAPRIAAALGLSQLVQSSGSAINSTLALALGAQALVDQFALNSVKVSVGAKSESYLLAADGITYLSEPWSPKRLVRTGNAPLSSGWLDINYYDYRGAAVQLVDGDGSITKFQQFGGVTLSKSYATVNGGSITPLLYIGPDVYSNRLRGVSKQRVSEPTVNLDMSLTVPPTDLMLQSGDLSWGQGGGVNQIRNSVGRTLKLYGFMSYTPSMTAEAAANGDGEFWQSDDGRFLKYSSNGSIILGSVVGAVGIWSGFFPSIPLTSLSLQFVVTEAKIRETLGYFNPNPIQSPIGLLSTITNSTNVGNADLSITYNNMSKVANTKDALNRQRTLYPAAMFDETWKFGKSIDATGAVTSILGDRFGKSVSTLDPIGRQSTATYTNGGQELNATAPEGLQTVNKYDLRGNKIEARQIAKPGSGLADLVTQYFYVEGASVDVCVNQITCNKLSYVIDPNHNRTDFTWDPSTGEMLTQTGPADSAGMRPMTTYGYSSFTGSDGVSFLLLSSKQEKVDATRNKTTTYEYDPNNHWVLKSVTESGDGVSYRSCFSTDAAGNVLSKTQPRANLTSCP